MAENDGREELIQPAERSITYGSYLKVNELLRLQQPLSQPPQHDETLFIIIHQVYELWFKQILHEVSKAAAALDDDQLMPFLRHIQRIQAIQSVLTHQVDILETMTPVDFNRFRDNLNPASGFQSYQFRLLEYQLGAKERAFIKFYKHDATASNALEKALTIPSLYDKFLGLMHKRGFPLPKDILSRDVAQPYESHPEVVQAMLAIYRNAEKHYELYLALEAMIDLDEGFLLWRYRHVAMVERMIGARKGTGGSSGVKYLSTTLSKRFFPEIWEVRNSLGGGTYGG